LYAFAGKKDSGGNTIWRYGYDFVPPTVKCNWEQLVADPIKCNYSDCYVFSEVLDNISQTLGIGAMKKVAVYGSEKNCSPVPGEIQGCGFLTKATPSLDPSFTGNAKPLVDAYYNRYVFTSHSLRQQQFSL